MGEVKSTEETHREIHELQGRAAALVAENIGMLSERVERLEKRGWRGRVVELGVYGLMGLGLGFVLARMLGG